MADGKTDIQRHPSGGKEHPPLTEQVRLNFARERLARIESKMQVHPKMESDERRKIGNNVWQLLSELEESTSIRKRDILHRAGVGHEGDSTKRLLHYAINPALPEKTQLKRAEALAIKVRRYVEIARAAAELCGKDPGSLISRVVEGTRYALLPEERLLRQEEASNRAWQSIVEMISAAARGIASQHGLQELFAEIISINSASLGGGPDVTRGYLATQERPRPALVDRGRELPPCPTVDLGGVVIEPHIPCKLEYRLEDDTELEAVYRQLVRQGMQSGSLRGHAVVRLDVSLALLPHGSGATVSPAFLLSPLVEFFVGEDFDGFARIRYKNRKIAAPDPVMKGQLIGDYWGSLPPERNIDCDVVGEPLLFAAFEKDGNACVWLNVFAEFADEELKVSYTNTTHAKIPLGGALVIAADEYAFQYLDYPLHSNLNNFNLDYPISSLKHLYCDCVYDRIQDDSKKIRALDKRASQPIFEEGTMLAAIERSLLSAPEHMRLDRILAKATEEFCKKSRAELKKLRHAEQIASENLRQRLQGLDTFKERFVKEYSQLQQFK